MYIAVIDAQGGGIGRQLVAALKAASKQHFVLGVGTNTAATAAMKKAGADAAATGENAVVVAARKADVLIGPIGMVIADALFGEITPLMAQAIGQSSAKRILIPLNHCDNFVVGVGNLNVNLLIAEAVSEALKCAGPCIDSQ